MRRRVVRRLAIAGLFLAAIAGNALGQSFSWRVSTYASGSAFTGLQPQALAVAADDSIYDLADLYYSDTGAVRISHHAKSDGALVWQVDMPLAANSASATSSQPTAAVATLQNDAIVATTQFGPDRLHGQITRYAAADGSVLWQHAEYAITPHYDLVYSALATDPSGDLVALGTSGEVNVTRQIGHATRMHGADGSIAWSVDVDPYACSTSAAAIFYFTNVAIDRAGDVVVAGFGTSSTAAALCVVKLAGATGHVIWAQAYATAAGTSSGRGNLSLAVDPNNNTVIGFPYLTGGVTPFGYALLKLDAGTGVPIWSQDPLTMAGAPVIAATLAVDASGDTLLSATATRKFASSDGHALWAQDAPVGGQIVLDAAGNAIVSYDNAYNAPELTLEFSALASNDGSSLWSSQLVLGGDGYYRADMRIAADRSGGFVAVQGWAPVCCSDKETAVLSATTHDGTVTWSREDQADAPEFAFLNKQELSSHTSLLTSDDAVITIASGVPGSYASGFNDGSAEIAVVKRATRDGHLLWRTMLPAKSAQCRSASIVLDAQGDVLIAGECDYQSLTAKLRGLDGGTVWIAALQGNCDDSQATAIAIDAANDAYVSGTCRIDTSQSEFVFKFAGATGAPVWARYLGTQASFPSRLLLDTGGNVVVAAGMGATDSSGNLLDSINLTRLHASDGSTAWSSAITPTANVSDTPVVLIGDSSGDVIVTGAASLHSTANGIVTSRIGLSNGAIKWQVRDANQAPVVAGLLYPDGDVVFASPNAVWKVSTADGSNRWLMSGAHDDQFSGLTLDRTGNILAGGGCSNGIGPQLCAFSLSGSSGAVGWRLVDTIYDQGFDILVVRDGSILVTANDAVTNSSPMSLVRIGGAFADDIFAGSFEP